MDEHFSFAIERPQTAGWPQNSRFILGAVAPTRKALNPDFEDATLHQLFSSADASGDGQLQLRGRSAAELSRCPELWLHLRHFKRVQGGAEWRICAARSAIWTSARLLLRGDGQVPLLPCTSWAVADLSMPSPAPEPLQDSRHRDRHRWRWEPTGR